MLRALRATPRETRAPARSAPVGRAPAGGRASAPTSTSAPRAAERCAPLAVGAGEKSWARIASETPLAMSATEGRVSPFLRILCCGTSHLRSCVNAPDLPFASRNYPGARILFGGRTDCEGCSCRVPSGLAALGGLVNAPRAPRKVSTATLARSDPKKSPPHPRDPLEPVRTRPCAVFVAREAAACESSVVPSCLETRPLRLAGGTPRRYLDRRRGPAAPLEMLARLHDSGATDVPGHPRTPAWGYTDRPGAARAILAGHATVCPTHPCGAHLRAGGVRRRRARHGPRDIAGAPSLAVPTPDDGTRHRLASRRQPRRGFVRSTVLGVARR